MMTVSLLISVDGRGRAEARIPFTELPPWSGRSLSKLIDDVTLDLMSKGPRMGPEELVSLAFCPRTELRRPQVALELPKSEHGSTPFKGKITCVIAQWPHEDFWLVTVPHQGPASFAVRRPGDLSRGLHRYLHEGVERRGRGWLERAAPRTDDVLELVEVPMDLPSPLPSRQAPRRARRKSRKKEARAEAEKRKLVAPVHLSESGESWTHRALDGRLPHVHGRDGLIRELHDEVSRTGAALLLVGPRGAGKSAIVQGLAHRLVEGRPGPLDRRDLWCVDANRIIAGMSMVGAWENRVTGMVQELKDRQDLLFVPDLPSLVYTGRSAHGDSNVAELLDPHLAHGELRLIGECTAERLEAVRDEAPGFFQRFRIIRIEEMDERETLLVLAQEARRAAEARELFVTASAFEAVLSLTRRFESQDALPGRAARLMRRVLAERRAIRERDDLGRPVMTATTITEHYGERTGLPQFVLRRELARPEEEIQTFLSDRIIGQPEAVAATKDLVLRIEQGLADPERPFGTYLFVGPTGVGKTETAKTLAELLFGRADRLVRLDMSEFQSPWSASRLFGDRSQPDGELTAQVARQPFSVVLLDEIEKAHPSVFDALLQVLGEGRLTNAAGHTVSFRSTVVIMTSNLGVRRSGGALGFGEATVEEEAARYTEAAQVFFRPEMFNRIDRVVPFRALTHEVMLPLTQRLLQSVLGRRGLARAETLVDVEPSLPEHLVARGFDPRYGARSMRRTLEAELAVPLAHHLIRAPLGGLSLIELFPDGSGVGLSVLSPRRLEGASGPRSEPARSWSAFDQRLERALERCRAIPSSARFRDLVQRRGELLERYNAGDEAAKDSLHTASSPLDALPILQYALEELVERADVVGFEEVIVSVPSGDLPFSARQEGRLPSARAARFVRGAFDDLWSKELWRLELRLLELETKMRASLQPPSEPRLVRVHPLGGGPASERFCLDLAAALRGHFGRTARIDDAPSPKPRRGAAFVASGPDLSALLDGELGIWVSRVTVGLSRGTAAALVTADLASARSIDAPRPKSREWVPAIVRWLDDGVGRDPGSGVQIGLDPAQLNMAWLLRQPEADG